MEPGPGYIKTGRGGLARIALSEDWLHKGSNRAKQVNALLNALMDSHPCIVEVGHKRPHFLTLFVIDGFGPWEHLLNRRGYVELVPVVITLFWKISPGTIHALRNNAKAK